MESRPQVVIIGAGLSGLTAALHLAERGLAPTVLEADNDYAGGRLRGGPPTTIEHLGQQWTFPSEHGIHGVDRGAGCICAKCANSCAGV